MTSVNDTTSRPSGRLTLRLLSRSDLHVVHSYIVRNREYHQPFEPVRENEYFTPETQLRLLELAEQEAAGDRAYRYGLFLNDGDELIGLLSFTGIARGPFQNAALGFSIDESRKGNGYMTEAVRESVRLAFGELDLHRVQAAVMPHNAASVRVLKKAGFRLEGEARHYLRINGRWEDHLLYAIVAEDLGRQL